MTLKERQQEIHRALQRLDAWLVRCDWKAYDPFDGLSSPLARLLPRKAPILKQVWQQGVRRCPLNLRPFLGIKPGKSSKGMGFLAQGYQRLYQTYGQGIFRERMKSCLRWLMDNRSPGFRGAGWGNHFDYQSRGGNIPKGAPTIVWTGLIGHAFLDAHEIDPHEQYLSVAQSACDLIVNELGWMELDAGVCLRYFPGSNNLIHNSNMIGASLLIRVNSISPDRAYEDLSARAVKFTIKHQTEEGAWYYGVGRKWEWIDSFHTGYVLEALDIFCRHSGSDLGQEALRRGYRFYCETFFEADGTPRYYAQKTPPLDIQCASQAIQTLVHLRELHPESVAMAARVAHWAISHMQDQTGYFYYRKYPLVTNKTPTLHWGQATMFAALALLNQHLSASLKARSDRDNLAVTHADGTGI